MSPVWYTVSDTRSCITTLWYCGDKRMVWRHVISSVHSPTSGYCVLSHIPMVWRHVISSIHSPTSGYCVLSHITDSHNKLDLIQSLVPTHYACNGYLHFLMQLVSITTKVARLIPAHSNHPTASGRRPDIKSCTNTLCM
jgi:hypothetical protein